MGTPLQALPKGRPLVVVSTKLVELASRKVDRTIKNGNLRPLCIMVREGVLGLYPCDSFCSGLHPRANLAGRVVAYPRCQPMRAAFAPKSPPSLRVLHLPVCLPKANGPTTSTRVPTHARCVCTQVPTHAT